MYAIVPGHQGADKLVQIMFAEQGQDGTRLDLKLLHLPEPVQLEIFSHLDAKSLIRVGASCRSFHQLLCFEEHAQLMKIWCRHCTDLLEPAVVTTHRQWARSMTPAFGYDPLGCASFWRQLYCDAVQLRVVRWWPGAGNLYSSSLSSASPDPIEVAPLLQPPSEARLSQPGQARGAFDFLARTGHSATVVGSRLVVVGGLTRESGPQMDIIVLDMERKTLIRPSIVLGTSCSSYPVGRFRHVASLLPPRGSDGEAQLVMLGGYNMDGHEFGLRDCYLLRLSTDSSLATWEKVTLGGQVPTPRFHHCANSYCNGHKLILVGGEGSQVKDIEETLEGLRLYVYVLDFQSMSWEQVLTRGQHPGDRNLHLSVVHKDQTGRERLVVVGGFVTSERRLADMTPHVLDLESMEWRRAYSDPELLPATRHRSASCLVGQEKMLVVGGGTTTEDGAPALLDDVVSLDLRTLQWQTPVQLDKELRAVSKTAGHSLDGLTVFGGCIRVYYAGVLAVVPVEQLEVLLLTSWGGRNNELANGPPLLQHPVHRRQVATHSSAGRPHSEGPEEEVRELQGFADWRGIEVGDYRAGVNQDPSINLPAGRREQVRDTRAKPGREHIDLNRALE